LEKNVKRSITVAGHRTSITMERPFWEALKEIAVLQKKSVNDLIAEVDKRESINLSSALRVFVLEFYKKP
jgi:predicted DNA-binding ribbon-helix-helix protein